MRHSVGLLNLITYVTVLIFILGTLLFPSVIDSAALWVVLQSVGLIGIPHGAIDHIMAAELYDLNQTLKDHLLFYASHLLVMVIVGVLWILCPEGRDGTFPYYFYLPFWTGRYGSLSGPPRVTEPDILHKPRPTDYFF